MFFLDAWLTTTYLSELSLSNRSRELFDAAPGDELNRLSLAPFADSDSELCESNLKEAENDFIFLKPHQRKTSNTLETLAHLENESDGMLLFSFQLLRTKKKRLFTQEIATVCCTWTIWLSNACYFTIDLIKWMRFNAPGTKIFWGKQEID